MKHGFREIEKGIPVPTIKYLKVSKDSMSGWNISFETENFKLTPENASKANINGEGHAHLVINGVKSARLYSKWFHIPELETWRNEIEITLNSNSHETLTLQNSPIKQKVYLDL